MILHLVCYIFLVSEVFNCPSVGPNESPHMSLTDEHQSWAVPTCILRVKQSFRLLVRTA